MTRGDVVIAVSVIAGAGILWLELAWHRANRRVDRDLARLRALGRDAVRPPRTPPDSTTSAPHR